MQDQTGGPLSRLLDIIRTRKLFLRERVPHDLKAAALLQYHDGVSAEDVSAHFDRKFSAQSVRNWWRRLSLCFSYLSHSHEVVVVDETSIHRGKRMRQVLRNRARGRGERHRLEYEARPLPPSNMLWVAINAETFEVVNLRLSKQQTNFDCYEFLAETRHRSRTDPLILHDRGPWYTSQTTVLELRHEQTRGGKRSRIECWNRQLKHRLDRFWRAFPPNCSSESAEIWLRSYAVVWNLTRP